MIAMNDCQSSKMKLVLFLIVFLRLPSSWTSCRNWSIIESFRLDNLIRSLAPLVVKKINVYQVLKNDTIVHWPVLIWKETFLTSASTTVILIVKWPSFKMFKSYGMTHTGCNILHTGSKNLESLTVLETLSRSEVLPQRLAHIRWSIASALVLLLATILSSHNLVKTSRSWDHWI